MAHCSHGSNPEFVTDDHFYVSSVTICLQYACQNNKASTCRILVDMGGANIQIRHTETGKLCIFQMYSSSIDLHIFVNLGLTFQVMFHCMKRQVMVMLMW